MTPIFLVLALVIQCSIIQAEDVDLQDNKDELLESFKRPEVDDEVVKDFSSARKDWMDMLMKPNLFPTSSLAMMQQAANSNLTAEEQLKNIKEIALQITSAIEREMENLMTYAVGADKETENNKLRKRRSTESPMDSTQMVMRLLRHIKSNNEYQNMAIEKMMSAQEIADKFGIEFTPDQEILSDLAVAANEHTQDLTNLLKDACELKNVTKESVEFVPYNDDQNIANDTYYTYALHEQEVGKDESVPAFEYEPEIVSKPETFNAHSHSHEPYHSHSHEPHHSHSHESQIPPPPHHSHHHHAPVTPRPNFYEPFPYTPDFYSSYYSEPITSTYLIIEDPEPEPEMIGEEIEETITTKLFVEKGDEIGSSTVNHVTTYTVAEKTHFRSPQIDRLPQQLQYCFLLI